MEATTLAEKRERPFIQGMWDTFPIVASGFFDGIVYAVIARQMGLSWTETVALSMMVNGASSQFAALGLIKQGIFGWPVILSTLLINARHIIYGLSLGPYLKGQSKGKLWVGSVSLSDETYGVNIHRFSRHGGDANYFLGSATMDYSLWQFSVMTGATIGHFTFDTQAIGLDFAFLATFIGLLMLQLTTRTKWGCLVLVGIVSTVAQYQWGPIAAVFFGTFTAIVYGGWLDE
ncbi:AzlC family ABC transporter permease [Ammoniphilus sp. CFH 90114]|uniref:AzlC family ABC transporter permease n=1 Tax=Ammoniphilus sp. CFH 90114 TaxID=2493665 RepID=UPI0013E8FEC5|nr:AzlC family ABC transporter permease [Ammoniphilus sp. CFH 90114]